MHYTSAFVSNISMPSTSGGRLGDIISPRPFSFSVSTGMYPVHPSPRKLIIFDADGTLRRCKEHQGPCHSDAGQWEVAPGVAETLAQYMTPPLFAVATNQAGIALGHRSYPSVRQEIAALEALLGVTWWRIRVCPHAPELGCLCRKPRPGMLNSIVEDYEQLFGKVEREGDVLFVGDSEDDRGAAQAAHIDFHWAHEFFAVPEVK